MVLFKITSPIFKESQERVDGINGVIGENIRGIRTVKTYTREEHEVAKFMKDNKLLRNVKLKVIYIMTILEPIIGVLINVALIGVLYFGGNLVFDNKLSNGELIAFISYTSQIFTGLFLMAGILMTVFPSIISFGRIKELLNTHSEITEKEVYTLVTKRDLLKNSKDKGDYIKLNAEKLIYDENHLYVYSNRIFTIFLTI